MTNFIEQLLGASPLGEREAVRARLRVAVTEELLEHMRRMKITKSQLAAKIGISRSAVTQALSSSRNLSLNTLADMANALALDPSVSFREQIAATPGITRGGSFVYSMGVASANVMTLSLPSVSTNTAVEVPTFRGVVGKEAIQLSVEIA